MTRRRWTTALVGSLVLVGGCSLPGGEEPQVRFEAASATLGDCNGPNRDVHYFADLNTPVGVVAVNFRTVDGAFGIGVPDEDGEVAKTAIWVPADPIFGVFEAVAEGGEVVATSNAIGPITVPSCL